MAVDGNCGFCCRDATLRDSHVLPAFVFRWLRERSGTRHIRNTENPNLRVQDGLKLKWLCDDCEGRFNRFETAFATHVFHPWHNGIDRIAYGDWLLKFCVSVSWRVLKYARGRNKNHSYTADQKILLDRAERSWRRFLVGETPHPGNFEQHLLIADRIEETTVVDLPENTNRFLTGAITLDIVGSDRSLMTFAKLGRFLIFGIIQKGPNRWEGTKVHVRHGVLQPGTFTVPAGLLDLIKEKSDHTSQAMEKISATQQTKINNDIEKNLDRFLASDHFKSIEADLRMFGKQAILQKSGAGRRE